MSAAAASMALRDYQQRAIDMTYDWLRNHDGNPCIVMPTGSGKSVVIAELCRDALQSWPETRILMLTHQRELIAQNAAKLRAMWPNAPLGIYSAGLGKRQLYEPITYASIQSVRTRAELIGHVDLVIVDECHGISHHAEGSYRTLLEALSGINPALRVIGLTATPYRLGHGLITDDQAIFDALLEPVGIAELVERGYLSVLRSKHTEATLSADGVRRRGGEYVERELQAAVDTESNNAAVVREIIERGQERSTWLIFCAGVQHARNIATLLTDSGIPTGCVVGDMPKAERDRVLADYSAGRLRALTNANVLTVGYDNPRIDLIAMLRPTLSPGLYVQMAGRGMRVAPGKADCVVFDFAGNITRHGPITDVAPPRKRRPGDAETAAPTKTCAVCGEIVHASVRVCPACAVTFPVREREPLMLDRSADIMGLEPREMRLSAWSWAPYVSRTSGNEMLRVCYYGEALSDPVVSEYLPLLNFGYAGDRAMRTLAQMARDAYVPMPTRQQAETNDSDWLQSIADAMSAAPPPERLIYRRDGRFHRVISRHWASLLSAPQPITEDHSDDDIPF